MSIRHSYIFPLMVTVRRGSPLGPLLRRMASPVKVAQNSLWPSPSQDISNSCCPHWGPLWPPPLACGGEGSLGKGALGGL